MGLSQSELLKSFSGIVQQQLGDKNNNLESLESHRDVNSGSRNGSDGFGEVWAVLQRSLRDPSVIQNSRNPGAGLHGAEGTQKGDLAQLSLR